MHMHSSLLEGTFQFIRPFESSATKILLLLIAVYTSSETEGRHNLQKKNSVEISRPNISGWLLIISQRYFMAIQLEAAVGAITSKPAHPIEIEDYSQHGFKYFQIALFFCSEHTSFCKGDIRISLDHQSTKITISKLCKGYESSLKPWTAKLEATKLHEGDQTSILDSCTAKLETTRFCEGDTRISLDPWSTKLKATKLHEGDQISGLDSRTAKLESTNICEGDQMPSIKTHTKQCIQTKLCKEDQMSSLKPQAKECNQTKLCKGDWNQVSNLKLKSVATQSFAREMNQV